MYGLTWAAWLIHDIPHHDRVIVTVCNVVEAVYPRGDGFDVACIQRTGG